MYASFDLFLFDFDGTLVDTEGAHFQAYQVLCREYGFELPWDFEQYAAIAHVSSQALQDALYRLHFSHIQAPSWSDLCARKKEIYLELIANFRLQLMPGVEKCIIELQRRNLRHAVVTHSTRSQVLYVVEKLPFLQRIPHWITREDYRDAKPSPDGYREAIRRLGKPEDRIVGFEDTMRGYLSLVAAGIHPLLISPFPQPVQSFRSLLAVLDFYEK